MKAFRLLYPVGTPIPATPAPSSMSETSRTCGGGKRGGYGDGMGGHRNSDVARDKNIPTQPLRLRCGDEIPEQDGDDPGQESRHVAGKRTDLTSPNSPKSTNLAHTLSETVLVSAAAAAPKEIRRRKPFRLRSSCPGLYCNNRDEGCEEREQLTQSTGTLPATQPRCSRVRGANAEGPADEGMATAEDAQRRETPTHDELIPPSGPKQEISAAMGDDGNPGAGEGSSMFQLPLKVAWNR